MDFPHEQSVDSQSWPSSVSLLLHGNPNQPEIAIVVYPAPAIFVLGLKGFFTTVGEPIIDSSGFSKLPGNN